MVMFTLPPTPSLSNQAQAAWELNVVYHWARLKSMQLANMATPVWSGIQILKLTRSLEMTWNNLLGIRLEMPRLMLDCSMLTTLRPTDGQNADGQLPMTLHSSTLLHTPQTGIQFATQPRLLSSLNQDIFAQLSASNGPIWWSARLETFLFPNKVWSICSVTSDSSQRLLSLPPSATFHSSTSPSVLEWLLSHTSSFHPSLSSLPFSCMMKWERSGLDKVWREKMVGSDSEVGSSRILTTDHARWEI